MRCVFIMEKNKNKKEKIKKERSIKTEKNITEETKKARQKFGTEVGEDATKYGEFVCSYFAWVTPDTQKKNVEKLEKITEKQKFQLLRIFLYKMSKMLYKIEINMLKQNLTKKQQDKI